MRLQTFGVVVMAGGALALAACGGGSADDGPATLQEIFERQFDSERFTEQQEAIRDCMVEQGFEYTPVDLRGADTQFSGARDFTDEDWVRENGFGITTGFGRLQDPSPAEDGGSGEDPNMAYRASLSPEQQEAYDIALYGQVQDVPGDDGGPGVIIRRGGPGDEEGGGGCFGEAFRDAGDDVFNSDLGDALEDLRQQIAGDERVIEANRDWAACMTDEGFTYASRDEAIQDVVARMSEIVGVEAPEGDRPGGVAIQVRPGNDPNATYDQAAMDELRQEEIRIATASLECGKDTIDEVEPNVREEYEEQFIEEHPELVAE